MTTSEAMYKDHLPLFKEKNTYLEDTCIYPLSYKCRSQPKCLFLKDMFTLYFEISFNSCCSQKFTFGNNYEYNVFKYFYCKNSIYNLSDLK